MSIKPEFSYVAKSIDENDVTQFQALLKKPLKNWTTDDYDFWASYYIVTRINNAKEIA